MALCSTHTQIPRHPYRGRRCCTEWGNRFRPASSLLHLLACSWPEPEPEPTRSGLRSAEGQEQESESLLPHMGSQKKKGEKTQKGDRIKKNPSSLPANVSRLSLWLEADLGAASQMQRHLERRTAIKQCGLTPQQPPFPCPCPCPCPAHPSWPGLNALGAFGPPNERVQLRGV